MSGGEVFAGFVVSFLTLAVFSFLYRDNPIYKFAEYLFVGVAAGYYCFVAVKDTIYPNGILEVYGGNLWRLGGGILGLVLLCRLFDKTAWLSRWPLALMIGTFAGLKMVGAMQSDILEQCNATMIAVVQAHNPNYVLFSWKDANVVGNLIMVLAVFCTLFYFFFSFERRGPMKPIAKMGIVFLMVAFGTFFGFTVLGRVMLLIGRARDLEKYGGAQYYYASIVVAVAVILALVVWRLFIFRPSEDETSPQG